MNKEIRVYSPQITSKITQDTIRAENVYIGNPVSTYQLEKERRFDNFLLKLNIVSAFAASTVVEDKICILDLGCGNGSNSRLIVTALKNILGEQVKIHIVYCDVSVDLLEEADRRTVSLKQEIPNLDYELVQLNINDMESAHQFAKDYQGKFNLIFSIKFFYNVPLKISGKYAQVFHTLLEVNGILLIQTYNVSGLLKNIKNGLKFILRKPYGNSSLLDRLSLKHNLSKYHMQMEYKVKCSAQTKLTFLNHFTSKTTEYYFRKKI